MATKSLTRSCRHLTTSKTLSPTASFLQLVPRRLSHTSSVLEFLAPRGTYHISQQTSHNRNARKAAPSHRSFTTTISKRATKAIINPSKDEDGNDMLVEITPRAAKRLREIMTKDSNPHLALRVQVESGGCHGFQYILSLSNIPSSSSSNSSADSSIPIESTPALNTSSNDPNAASSPPAPASPTETTATPKQAEEMQELDEEDVVFQDEDSGAKVVIDVSSLELLKGSKIEYTTGLIGSQFTVVNPNSSSNCGCGTSFDIKI